VFQSRPPTTYEFAIHPIVMHLGRVYMVYDTADRLMKLSGVAVYKAIKPTACIVVCSYCMRSTACLKRYGNVAVVFVSLLSNLGYHVV
jgi:hypothetical protein